MKTENSINTTLETTDVLWKLSDLYKSTTDKSVKDDSSWCKKEAATLTDTYKGKIGTLNAQEIFELVKRLEDLHSRLGKLATFGFLNFTTQVDNAIAGGFYQQIRELASLVEKNTIFFELEWNTLDAKQFEKLLPRNK